MAATWRIVRVFISSTFRDMQAQRDHLRDHVFPRFEEKLRERGHNLEPIDLHEGVETADASTEAARELLVLKVCLDEITRSRPCLIVLARPDSVPDGQEIQSCALPPQQVCTNLSVVMISAYRIFISCVSKEFKSYRDELRSSLTGPNREIKVQEDFTDGGATLLEKLDDYIISCQAMIHLVGNVGGGSPQHAEVRNLLGRYPNLPTELPELAADLQADCCPFTYTQWEAVLAIYHCVDCFIYLANEGSKREPDWKGTPADLASQNTHCARLRMLGQDCRVLPFVDARDVALRFLSAITTPAEAQTGEAVLSQPAISWPAPPVRIEYPLADREAEFDTFLRLITNQATEHIFLITGPSDRGKSVLVGQFAELADRLGVRCAHEEFKTGLPLPEVLWDLAQDLAPIRFPRFERERRRQATETLRTAFLQDLDKARVPILLILDTYEQATEEARQWVEQRFLPHFRRHAGLRLVLAGKVVPETEGHPWSKLAIRNELPPIRDAAHWQEFSRRVHGVTHPDDKLQFLVQAAQGSPRVLGNLLGNLRTTSA